jgi:hypothetical protein
MEEPPDIKGTLKNTIGKGKGKGNGKSGLPFPFPFPTLPFSLSSPPLVNRSV